jgi:hypothetical protein
VREHSDNKEAFSMITSERINLVAPCGIDCGTCELYVCRDNPQLLSYLASRGIPKDNLPCAGCRDLEGCCPVIAGPCASYACAQEKGVAFCFDCGDFPCSKLNPAADRADVLPHNIKVFNLCTIQLLGVEGFVEVSSGIKTRYFKGKMEIGKGPQLAD